MTHLVSKNREAFLAAFDGMLAEYRSGASAKVLMLRVGMKAASFYDELSRRGLSVNAPRSKYQKRLIKRESLLAEERVREATADGWDPAVLFKQPALAQRVPVSLEGEFIKAPSLDRLKAQR